MQGMHWAVVDFHLILICVILSCDLAKGVNTYKLTLVAIPIFSSLSQLLDFCHIIVFGIVKNANI